MYIASGRKESPKYFTRTAAVRHAPTIQVRPAPAQFTGGAGLIWGTPTTLLAMMVALATSEAAAAAAISEGRR
jgi:hypothetical protein